MKIRNIPFGWKYENGKKVLHEREADVLRNMYRDYIAGQIALRRSSRNLKLLRDRISGRKNRLEQEQGQKAPQRQTLSGDRGISGNH